MGLYSVLAILHALAAAAWLGAMVYSFVDERTYEAKTSGDKFVVTETKKEVTGLDLSAALEFSPKALDCYIRYFWIPAAWPPRSSKFRPWSTMAMT